MAELKIELNTASELADLFGAYDANVTVIEKALPVRIAGSREDGCTVIVSSQDAFAAENAKNVLLYLVKLMSMGEVVDESKVEYALSMVLIRTFRRSQCMPRRSAPHCLDWSRGCLGYPSRRS